ncbi:hypothetical protein SAMN05428975_4258 [Mucilaginibacter sp. OK268]|nr:hypothetical protein SAMN05428975_4258 [Mucilaginibacter sp. OK268]
MLSSVEAWWAGLCAPPFDGAQGDNPAFCDIIDVLCLMMGYYLCKLSVRTQTTCKIKTLALSFVHSAFSFNINDSR